MMDLVTTLRSELAAANYKRDRLVNQVFFAIPSTEKFIFTISHTASRSPKHAECQGR